MKITINNDGELIGIDLCHCTALLLTNGKMEKFKVESVEIKLSDSCD